MRFHPLLCALLTLALCLPGTACCNAVIPASAQDSMPADALRTQGPSGLMIGLCAASCTAIAAAAVLIGRRRRPAFPADSRIIVMLSPEEQGWAPLASCGKESITLARLMLSCQLYPPPCMPMEALSDMVLAPARGGAVLLRPGRRARGMTDGLPDGPVTLHPGSELVLPGMTLRYITG